MAYILHIDTSGENSLTALAKDGVLLGSLTNSDARNHAAVINLHINQLLHDNGLSLQDIAAFCVCGGPGSYTGLRIGMATAKGFCYALDKPLMMHSRLLLMAGNHITVDNNTTVVSILQARQKEYFVAAYNRHLQPVHAPQHIHYADLHSFMTSLEGKILIVGYNDEDIQNVLPDIDYQYIADANINVDTWVRYSFGQYNCNEFVNLANIEPFYLKQVYTHKPKTIN